MASGLSPRVVLIGTGIAPIPVAADKTFLLQLSPLLRERGIDVKTVSIIETPPGDHPDDVLYLPRSLHADTLKHYTFDASGQAVGYHHQHAGWRQTLELAHTLFSRQRDIRAFAGGGGNVVFHWMDLSTLIPLIRRTVAADSVLVAGLPQLVPRSGASDWLRAAALSSADSSIVGTRAAARGLRDHRCRCPRIDVLPWGAVGASAQAALETPRPRTHLLWTGFIRQIGHADFKAALAVARRVVAARSDIEFTFCLKPQLFNEHYAALASEGVNVVAGGSDFVSTLPKYSALFSPVLHASSTMAPPLSWIDALSAGLPILTTVTQGIEEIITTGRTGYVGQDYPDLEAWLLSPDVGSQLEVMRGSARRLFEARYEIGAVADNYARLYRELAVQEVVPPAAESA